MLNFELIKKAEINSEFYPFFTIKDVFLNKEDHKKIATDFPNINKGGSFPSEVVSNGGANPSFSLKNSIVVLDIGFPNSSTRIPDRICSKPLPALHIFSVYRSVSLHFADSSNNNSGVASSVKLLWFSAEDSVGLP